MSANPEDPPSKDALGLDIDSLKITDLGTSPNSEQLSEHSPPSDAPTSAPTAAKSPEPQDSAEQQEQKAPTEPAPAEATSPTTDGNPAVAPRERKKPYINPERVKTGGAQREKLSEEELTQRMARIREQNEKIKQRRLDVEEDEREFKKTQQEERQRLARTKKVQDSVDRAREQNARRKMEKIQNREWDSGKPGVKPSAGPEASNPANQPPAQTASIDIRGGHRGGGPGRGRGRGAAPPPVARTVSGNKSAETTGT